MRSCFDSESCLRHCTARETLVIKKPAMPREDACRGGYPALCRTCYRLQFCYRNILDASLSQATNALLTMSQSTPTLAQLQRGLQLSEQIAALEAELAALFSGSPAPKAAAAPVAKAPAALKKGGISAAGRARIVAAQKARWAKIRAGKAPAPKAEAAKAAKATGKKKRVVSPEVKAKLAAAMKARWAAAKAGKGPSPTSKKK